MPTLPPTARRTVILGTLVLLTVMGGSGEVLLVHETGSGAGVRAAWGYTLLPSTFPLTWDQARAACESSPGAMLARVEGWQAVAAVTEFLQDLHFTDPVWLANRQTLPEVLEEEQREMNHVGGGRAGVVGGDLSMGGDVGVTLRCAVYRAGVGVVHELCSGTTAAALCVQRLLSERPLAKVCPTSARRQWVLVSHAAASTPPTPNQVNVSVAGLQICHHHHLARAPCHTEGGWQRALCPQDLALAKHHKNPKKAHRGHQQPHGHGHLSRKRPYVSQVPDGVNLEDFLHQKHKRVKRLAETLETPTNSKEETQSDETPQIPSPFEKQSLNLDEIENLMHTITDNKKSIVKDKQEMDISPGISKLVTDKIQDTDRMDDAGNLKAVDEQKAQAGESATDPSPPMERETEVKENNINKNPVTDSENEIDSRLRKGVTAKPEDGEAALPKPSHSVVEADGPTPSVDVAQIPKGNPVEEEDVTVSSRSKPLSDLPDESEYNNPIVEEDQMMEEPDKPMKEEEHKMEEPQKPMKEEEVKKMEEPLKPMKDREEQNMEEPQKPMKEEEENMEEPQKPMKEEEDKKMEEPQEPMKEEEEKMEESQTPMKEKEDDEEKMKEPQKPMKEDELKMEEPMNPVKEEDEEQTIEESQKPIKEKEEEEKMEEPRKPRKEEEETNMKEPQKSKKEDEQEMEEPQIPTEGQSGEVDGTVLTARVGPIFIEDAEPDDTLIEATEAEEPTEVTVPVDKETDTEAGEGEEDMKGSSKEVTEDEEQNPIIFPSVQPVDTNSGRSPLLDDDAEIPKSIDSDVEGEGNEESASEDESPSLPDIPAPAYINFPRSDDAPAETDEDMESEEDTITSPVVSSSAEDEDVQEVVKSPEEKDTADVSMTDSDQDADADEEPEEEIALAQPPSVNQDPTVQVDAETESTVDPDIAGTGDLNTEKEKTSMSEEGQEDNSKDAPDTEAAQDDSDVNEMQREPKAIDIENNPDMVNSPDDKDIKGSSEDMAEVGEALDITTVIPNEAAMEDKLAIPKEFSPSKDPTADKESSDSDQEDGAVEDTPKRRGHQGLLAQIFKGIFG